MEKLNSKVVWIFFVRFIFSGLFFFLFLMWMSWGIAGPKIIERADFFSWMILLPIILFILYLIFCYIWAKLTYRFWLYEITDDTFKVERGVIWKKYTSIPYERIQNIDIHRGVIARILGLSELRLQTAGFGGSQGKWGAWAEGRLPGIEREKAEQLREKLIAKVKGTKQGL